MVGYWSLWATHTGRDISGEARLFFFQWDQEDWKQTLVILAYVVIGVAGAVYILLDAGELRTFLSGLADVGGALFLFALVTEGAVLVMVMALGKIREARDRGREEGREEGRAEGRAEGLEEGRAEEYAAMLQTLREVGISESDIQRVQIQRDARGNGRAEG